jgi:hypothetical protein
MQILPRQPTPPKFSFELTNEAAKKNFLVLMHNKYRGNFAASLESQRDSMVGYGSEFRDKDTTLSHLISCHPNWNQMTQILQNGSEWPLEPTQQRQQMCGCQQSTHLQKPQGSLDATRAAQETSLEGHPFRLLPSSPTHKSHKDSGHSHRPHEHTATKHHQ